jgi:hypothetical protein
MVSFLFCLRRFPCVVVVAFGIMGSVSSATTAAPSTDPSPPPLVTSYYTQEEIDENQVCDSKYRDLITLDFATENPRLFRNRYLECESLVRCLVQNDESSTPELSAARRHDVVPNPVGGVGNDLVVARTEVEASINACPSQETMDAIRQAVKRYHAREDRRKMFESQRDLKR